MNCFVFMDLGCFHFVRWRPLFSQAKDSIPNLEYLWSRGNHPFLAKIFHGTCDQHLLVILAISSSSALLNKFRTNADPSALLPSSWAMVATLPTPNCAACSRSTPRHFRKNQSRLGQYIKTYVARIYPVVQGPLDRVKQIRTCVHALVHIEKHARPWIYLKELCGSLERRLWHVRWRGFANQRLVGDA